MTWESVGNRLIAWSATLKLPEAKGYGFWIPSQEAIESALTFVADAQYRQCCSPPTHMVPCGLGRIRIEWALPFGGRMTLLINTDGHLFTEFRSPEKLNGAVPDRQSK